MTRSLPVVAFDNDRLLTLTLLEIPIPFADPAGPEIRHADEIFATSADS
jgi:hypothetical protein